MPIVLLLIGVIASFHTLHAETEATLTADTIAANVSQKKSKNAKKEVIVTAKGNVVLSSEDFTVNTEELSVNSTTKYTVFPKETKIFYNHTNPITIYSDHLEGNPQKEDLHGDGIIMKSSIISYKSKTIDVAKPLAKFKTVKFSTCQMFNESNTECNVPWHGSASTLTYNYETKVLKAKNFRMNLHNVPIFYIPYIKLNFNEKKEGIQNFNIIRVNNQQGLTFNYIKHSKRYGRFVLRPEFYLNENTSRPELSRGNNFAFLHDYQNQEKHLQIKSEIKLAPNVNIPTNEGLYSGLRASRYYIRTENDKASDNSSFRSAVNLASDRFLQQVYNLQFQNYLQTNFTYTNFNQTDRIYRLDATHYNPVTATNKDTIPSYISSAMYNKTLTKPTERYTVVSRNEVLDFYRADGTSGVRTTTMLDGGKQFQAKGLHMETNPNLRLTHYRYFNNNDITSNHAERVVGDINVKIYKPFLHQIRSFVIQTKPTIFIDYTTDKTFGTVVNEDSFANFVRDDNVFLRSRYNGIDLVDRGLKAAYGIDLFAQDDQNRKFTFFLAQRYNTNENLSNYVGRASAEFGKMNFTSRFILDKQTSAMLFSNSNVKLESSSFLEVGLGYFFLDESLQSKDIVDITNTENIMYSLVLKHNKHQLFADIIQNPSFFSTSGKKENRITGITGGIGYNSDCLFYRIGVQRRIIFTGTQNMVINSFILEFKIAQ